MKDFKDIKVAVAGTGYVGLSIATLLAQHHHVSAVDVIPEKGEKLPHRSHRIHRFFSGNPTVAPAFCVFREFRGRLENLSVGDARADSQCSECSDNRLHYCIQDTHPRNLLGTITQIFVCLTHKQMNLKG